MFAAIPESTNASFAVPIALLLRFLDQAGTRLIRKTSSKRLTYRSAVAWEIPASLPTLAATSSCALRAASSLIRARICAARSMSDS